jgi:hypothetical protein
MPRGSGFSGLRGSVDTDFTNGVDDRGAYGGKANKKGFEQASYRYGYASQNPEYDHITQYHYIQHLHTMQDEDAFSNQ